jgi:phage gp36-like protein
VSSYCTRAELAGLGINADALRGITTTAQDAAIVAASAEMDGYLGARYKLPLSAWGADVSMMCARLAVYLLISVRGFNANDPGDAQILEAHDMAERWLSRIAAGNLAPQVTDSAAQGAGHVSGGVMIGSNSTRGYQDADGLEGGGAFTGARRS